MSRIFITGGKAQGKTEYSKRYISKGYHVIDDICETVSEYVLDEKVSGNGTQEGTASDADRMADEIMSRLMTGAEDHKDIVFIGTETGCGIVPTDSTERLFREVNGRLNCLLAASADTVILLNCGIAQVIKG